MEAGRRRLMARIAARWKMREAAAFFHAWAGDWRETKAVRGKLSKFGLRLKNQGLSTAYTTWYCGVKERARVRGVMARIGE